MEWRLGTMGFSYPDWAGPFYPKGVKPGDYLSYYARCFDTVEMDTTFYAVPDADRVRKWTAAVPEGFRFAVKAPKSIVQELPLHRATKPMEQFVALAREFGTKLGPVLIQFAPSFEALELKNLATFLRTLPKDVRYAVEFRHSSWDNDETEQLLRGSDICWAASHYVVAPMPLRATTDFLYVRWIGRHKRFEKYGRERIDVRPHLQWWRAEIEKASGQIKQVFGYFSDDYAGFAVATCNRFKRMLGLPAQDAAPGSGLFH